MSLADYLENAVINWMRGTAMPTAPTTLYVGLLTTIPTDASAGTEPTYAGYARQAVTLTAPPSPVSNTATVTFPAVAGSNVTVVGCALYTASTAGNQLAWDADMVDKTISVGDVPEFAAGALTFTLD